jgi:hypothetical protein
MNPNPIVMTEVTDPVEIAKARASLEKFEQNYAWLEAHASEVFSHRGKYICIAGQELFVGGDGREVLERARAAHPEDDGPLTRYIPKDRGARIFVGNKQCQYIVGLPSATVCITGSTSAGSEQSPTG